MLEGQIDADADERGSEDDGAYLCLEARLVPRVLVQLDPTTVAFRRVSVSAWMEHRGFDCRIEMESPDGSDTSLTHGLEDKAA